MSGVATAGAISNIFTGPDHSAGPSASIIWSALDIDWEATATEEEGRLIIAVNDRDDVAQTISTIFIPVSGGVARNTIRLPFFHQRWYIAYQVPLVVTLFLQRGSLGIPPIGPEPTATANLYEMRLFARDRVGGLIIDG